jgi:predicted AlkP superfamily phosphohydrolase/phosphomutase
MGNRVIVLGIDGATFDLLLPWVEQGKLPNLKRTLQEGSYGVLHSTIPPYSAQAWVSMMTGRQPSKHGVVDFFERQPGRQQHAFISSTLVQGETIWEILGRHGKRVGAVNVPLTYPPLPVNGYMVSGFMTPRGRDDYTYPPELRDEIMAVTGQYDPDPWDLLSPDQDLVSIRRWMGITEQAARYLHDRHPVDVYVSVIQALDHLQHHFWDALTAEGTQRMPEDAIGAELQDCYKALDEAIGVRLQWLDEDTTLFMASDHGFQPVNSWFHVNHWLAEQGFLRFTVAHAGAFRTAITRLGWSREGLKKWVRRLDPLGLRRVLGRFTRAAIADKIDDSLSLPIDWSQTVAYSGSRTSEGIYINLKGREPGGVVEPGQEYEQVRARIMDALASLVDPRTGQPAVSAVYRREDVYSGPYTEQMPDILFALDDKPYLVSESTVAKEVFTPMDEDAVTGRHHSLGLFAAMGPQIRRGATTQANIVDIAPTILYALDLPVPRDMDGRVLEEVFTAQYRAAHPVRYEDSEVGGPGSGDEAQGYNQEEEQEMLRRLRGLGYID